MTVREIIDHFIGDHKVTIIERNEYVDTIYYIGYTDCCLHEIPIDYIDKVCRDWKVIGDMLTIWI